MNGGLNKIATALIAVFLLTFLLLIAQILYILFRRRRHQPNEKCFYLFWRNQSRIEPKEIASISKIYGDSDRAVVVETAAEDEFEKWQELCGPSRTLFTIKEEEEREGIIECFEYDDPFPKSDEDTTPFHTPCASPAYFTPSSSPSREFPADRGCSDDNRTTSFSAIQITIH